jgi:hypothetical protein
MTSHNCCAVLFCGGVARLCIRRYSVATQWAEKTGRLTGSSSTPNSATISSSSTASPEDHKQHSSDAIAHPQAVMQQQQQPSSQLTQKQLQNKPQVAVITAAGPIMQAAGGSPGASAEGMVESHKLVRVLRAMRENPQVSN